MNIWTTLENIGKGTWNLDPAFQSLIFTEPAPLRQFSHKVAMSVYLCVVLCHRVQFFSRPLIGPQVTWSVPGLSLVLPPPSSPLPTPAFSPSGQIFFWHTPPTPPPQIREKNHLLTDADSSTNTNKILLIISFLYYLLIKNANKYF